MNAPRPSVLELRAKLSSLTEPSRKQDFLKSRDLSDGIPKGVLCEITGTARTEWVISLLCDNPTLWTFWVEDQLTILPTAIQQRGGDVSRILMAEAGDRLFQVLRKALRSKLFDCLILPGVIHEMKMLKSLQIFARDSNAAVLFLSKLTQHSWTISYQIETNWSQDGKNYSTEVVKSKYLKNSQLD